MSHRTLPAAATLLFLSLALVHQTALADTSRTLDSATLAHYGAAGLPRPESISLTRTAHGAVIRYCPDNTCEILSDKSGIPDETLTVLAVSYLYYLSRYYCLKPWQEDPRVEPALQKGLAAISDGSCERLAGKASVACELKRRIAAGTMTLQFSRYDEGAEGFQDLIIE